jgi:hypothetical protein
MVSFPQISPPTSCAHLSLPPYVPHAQPIPYFSNNNYRDIILIEITIKDDDDDDDDDDRFITVIRSTIIRIVIYWL